MNQTFTKSGRKRRLLGLIRTFFLIYLSIILSLPVNALAQSGRFTIAAKQISLSEVFKMMKAQQKGLDFFYSNDELDVSRKLDVNVSNVSLDELMQLILPKAYTYEYIDNHLVIKPRATGYTKLQEQVKNLNVNGIVRDEAGMPIPGVIVKSKLSKSTAVTDIEGRYLIEVQENDILTFSYIGFKTQELGVDSKKTILNVTLKQDMAYLNEVVVTGYQILKKKNAPGSIGVISEKEIEQSNNRSLNRLLEGAVPGLIVYKDAKGLDDLRIRGGSSLRSGTQPLLVVDGFVTTILPNINEIENITVLKDASASAVWGSQAANGVIVLTTKKGKNGKLQINYSGNIRVANRPDYDELRRADAATLIDYQKEQYDKGYIIAPIFDGSKSGYSQSIGIFNDYDRKDITLAQRDQRLATLAGLSNKDQINNLLLRPAASQSHYLSFSGGSDKAKYFLSTNYQSNLGGAKQNNSDVMTINSRNTFTLANFVDLRTDLSATYSSGRSGYSDMEGNIRKLLPYQMLKDAQGNYVYDYINFNKVENDRLKTLGYLDNGFNLLQENEESQNTSKGWGLRSKVGLDWKIIQGLSLSNDFIYERTTNTLRNLYAEKGYDVRTLVNRLTSVDAANKLVFNIPKGDVLDLNTSTYNNYAFRNQLNYVNTFNTKHFVHAIAGFDLRKAVNESNRSRRLGYNDDLLSFQNIDAKVLASPGIVWWDGSRQTYNPSSYEGLSFIDNREYSFYSTLTYTYDGRYNISGSYRTDHSNLFGADPKFKRTPLWSIGGQWNISNEPFFQSKTISNLGLRVTYGLTGNFDRNSLTTTYLVATRFFNAIANDYVARLSTPPNPKLRWERSQTFNLGTDIGVLNNRFTMSLDYYRKYSYDLLGNQDLDPTVGMGSAMINAANMTNHGIEMGIKAGIISTNSFNWTSNFNLAYNKNKVTSNKITDSSPAINRPNGVVQFLEGYPRESVWSYKWAGLDNAGRPQVFDGEGKKIYIPNVGSLVYSGTARPKLSGGWTNTFRYKGFEAMAFLVFNFGHVIRREMPTMYGYDWSGAYNNQIAQRWRQAGDELKTDIPAIPALADLSDNYTRAATLSSNSIADASFVRLREIQLGYNFRPTFLKGTPFKSIRMVAQMNNVTMFRKNKYGIDPEAMIGSTYALPEPLTTTFGLNFGL